MCVCMCVCMCVGDGPLKRVSDGCVYVCVYVCVCMCVGDGPLKRSQLSSLAMHAWHVCSDTVCVCVCVCARARVTNGTSGTVCTLRAPSRTQCIAEQSRHDYSM
jgi:hypothetical protein